MSSNASSILEQRRDKFAADATALHDGRYDYSAVDYVNSRTKVEIHCPVGHTFHQIPKDHLKGNGCPDCAGRKGSSLEARAQKFLASAIAKHGDRYWYDLSTYVDFAHGVRIVCEHHGEFHQRATKHLQGSGCPDCSNSKASSRDARAGWFVIHAVAKHDSAYTYDHVVYIDANTKVDITCAIHGDFPQRPSSHLEGKGCPACGEVKAAVVGAHF